MHFTLEKILQLGLKNFKSSYSSRILLRVMFCEIFRFLIEIEKYNVLICENNLDMGKVMIHERTNVNPHDYRSLLKLKPE